MSLVKQLYTFGWYGNLTSSSKEVVWRVKDKLHLKSSSEAEFIRRMQWRDFRDIDFKVYVKPGVIPELYHETGRQREMYRNTCTIELYAPSEKNRELALVLTESEIRGQPFMIEFDRVYDVIDTVKEQLPNARLHPRSRHASEYLIGYVKRSKGRRLNFML